MERGDRIIAQETIEGKDLWVSTVFLGVNHNFSPHGPPLLFETTVFRTNPDNAVDRYTWDEVETDRYTTIEEAREGHKAMVAKHSDTTVAE